MNRLDIGCGVQKKPDYYGIDKNIYSDADLILDFTKEPLPNEDNSVDHIHCADVIEHMTYKEMIFLFNEIYRVLRPYAEATINTVYGMDGWTRHPNHLRPIFENQFNYFTVEALKSPTFNNMSIRRYKSSIYGIKQSK